MGEPLYTLEYSRNALRDIRRRLERLSPRQRRRLFRQIGLDADLVRIEEERCQDILTLYGHVDRRPPLDDPEAVKRYLDSLDLT